MCPLCKADKEMSEHLHSCEAVQFRQPRFDECLAALRAAGTAPDIANC